MAFDIRPRIRRAFRLALRRRDLTDAEIDEEICFHIDSRVVQLMARGLTRDQARAQAMRRFGASWDDAVARLYDAGHLREERLAMRERLDAAWSDLTYAVRTLMRQPGFAIVVVLTFALGIGANATMFGVIDRLLLRPPPHVARAHEVVAVGIATTYRGQQRFFNALNYPLYELLRADTAAFGDVIVATGQGKSTLGSGATAEELFTTVVNAGYFAALGTRPALGRFFLPDEDRDGAYPTVVLSYGLWQSRFGGDRAILGRRLRIGPTFFTVVGIAPPGFTGVEPKRIDAWIPIAAADGFRLSGTNWKTDWGSYWLRIYARVRPGVRMDAAAERVATMYANGYAAWSADTRGLPEKQRRFVLRSILPSEQLGDNAEVKVSRLLVGVAALVLLIACANVANLLLARGAERRREIAVRLALGVTRARLLRLLLAETVVLAVSAGVVALLATQWGVRIMHATLLGDYAWVDSAFDGRVVAVTLGLVFATTLLAGLVPALRSSAPNVTDALKACGREGSRERSRVRTGLVIAQAALSVILMVGAGLFVQSLRKVAAVRLGYEPERVIAGTMDLEALGYKDADREALFHAMRERVASLPGVADATVSDTHPLHGWGFGISVRVPGRDSLPEGYRGGPYYNAVGPGYFSTLGLQIVEGRPITDADMGSMSRVALLSESMASAYWPHERAVGRCIMLGSDSACTTVIGVAADAKEQLNLADTRFLLYVPSNSDWHAPINVLLVRARDDDPGRLVEPIRRAMQNAAPDLPYAEVQTFEELLAPQLRPWKMGATLFGVFGVLALLIAAVGLYSAISYGVARRRHEFGVRMALGAQINDVVRLVMRQGMWVVVIGVGIGTAVALLAGRLVAGLLFDTSPRNPAVLVAVALVSFVVAAAALFIPARRASRADPAAALRGE
jgi:predicted permease